MTYHELQSLVNKYPFLYGIIESIPLNELRLEFKNYKEFIPERGSKITFIMTTGVIKPVLHFSRTSSKLIEAYGKPRFFVYCHASVVEVLKCRKRQCKSSRFTVYDDPVERTTPIHYDMALLGSARVMSRHETYALLKGLCKSPDGKKYTYVIRADHVDCTNPHESHFPEATFSQGHWTFIIP